jgi:hypothetical protein
MKQNYTPFSRYYISKFISLEEVLYPLFLDFFHKVAENADQLTNIMKNLQKENPNFFNLIIINLSYFLSNFIRLHPSRFDLFEFSSQEQHL